MAFTVEDGTSVNGANAYVTADYFKAYHKDRGTTITSGGGDIQAAIIRATDFMSARWLFVGVQLNSTQGLHWPARDARYRDGRLIGSDEVPVEVMESCAEYAKRELDSPGALTTDPTYEDSNAIVVKSRDKVGPIEEEREFGSQGSPQTWRKFPKPDELLRRTGLVITGNRLLRS